MERPIWGFGDGSTVTVLDTNIGRLGAVICWENYMPLLRTAMYAKGVEIYCAPTADDRDTRVPTMQHVALEGRCFASRGRSGLDGGRRPRVHHFRAVASQSGILACEYRRRLTCTAACGGGPVSFDLNEDIIRAGLNYRFWMN